MSSMKNFKSKLSQKRGHSRSQISHTSGSQSMHAMNLSRLDINFRESIKFQIEQVNDKIVTMPQKLKMINNTGTRIFINVEASNDQLFEVKPKRHILQNKEQYAFQIKFIEMPYAQLDDYESETFQIMWGKISSEEISKKSIPQITNQKFLDCVVANKEKATELIAKQIYQSHKTFNQNDNPYVSEQSGLLKVNPVNNDYFDITKSEERDTNIRSRIMDNTYNPYEERQSLLSKNVITIVALVSFVLGFLS